MTEHDDPKFDAWLQEAARSYHRPAATPREEMWAGIVARRRRRAVMWRVSRWAVAAAAVLVLGIGIGRWSAESAGGGDAGTTATGEAPNGGSRELIYQVAATEYLSRTEAFLTGFRAELRGSETGAVPPRFAGQARDLLSTTRLMLDSPVAEDMRLRALLEDLELVLVQISQLGAAGDVESDWITQGMNQTNVLPRLRSAIPAGPLQVRTEGVL